MLLGIAKIGLESKDFEELVEQLLQILCDFFHDPLAIGIHLWQASAKHFRLVGWRGLPDAWLRWSRQLSLDAPVIGEAQRAGRVVLLTTAEELEQAVGRRIRQEVLRQWPDYVGSVHIPLRSREAAVGVLSVLGRRERQLPIESVPFLHMIGDYVGMVLDQAHQRAVERRRANHLALVHSLTQGLADTRSREDILSRLSQQLREAVSFDDLSLTLVEEGGGQARLFRQYSPTLQSHEEGVLFSLAGTELARVYEQGGVSRNCHLVTGGRLSPLGRHLQDRGMKSSVVIPLKRHNAVIGTLNLGGRREDAFSQEDMAVLTAVGELLTLALGPVRSAHAEGQQPMQSQPFDEQGPSLLPSLSSGQPILDTLPAAALLLDGELRIVSMNRKFGELFGVSEEAAVGKFISQFRPGIESGEFLELNKKDECVGEVPITSWAFVLRLINEVRRRGGLREAELSLSSPGAQQKILRALVYPLASTKSELRMLVMLEDISEKVHFIEHLVQTEKRAAMGELAVTIAHELGNPMGLISSALQFVRDQLHRERVRIPPELVVVEENVERMHELLKSLSEFSGLEDLRLSLTDVHQALARVLAFVRRGAESHQARIETQFDDQVPACWIDSKQLKQVFLNLFKNAIEAMPQGGRLLVRTRWDPADTMSRQGTVVIEISDTGTGIPSADLREIFKPFYTTKDGGSGLGLFFCQRIIEKHGGYLRVKSQPQVGTTFTIHLPVDPGHNHD